MRPGSAVPRPRRQTCREGSSPVSLKRCGGFGLRERGSALIAILWIVAILSLAIFAATQFLFVELESESNASGIFRAEQLADRGFIIAAHPLVERGDPLLEGRLSANESYAARLSSEGERLNLNSLLENPEDDRIVLEELFVRWGLRRDEAMAVVDNLIDWVDEDDEPTNRGAEIAFYYSRGQPHFPYNRPFHSLDEVELVHLFDLVIAANPAWRESFTLLSEGQLDLNEAPAELIAAASEGGMAAAERFVSVRNGLDQIPGTDDDIRFSSVEEALDILGIPTDFADTIADRFTVEDSTRRIVSVGRFGSIAVERAVTLRYTGERGQILQWATRRIQ